MTNKDIEQLINKYLDGETSPAEECQLARELQRTDIPEEWQAVRLMLGELTLGEAEYDAVMAQRSNKPKSAPRQRRLWPWFGAIAASIVLLLVFHFTQEPVEKQPVVAKVVEQVTLEPVSIPPASDSREEPVIEEYPAMHIKSYKTHNVKADPKLAQVDSLPKEEEPVIPADKQAMVDIYLAEEALQVAYELRAQQEAIRAYAASLTGEEPAKAIIAF